MDKSVKTGETAQVIKKEDIPSLTFSKEDVLTDPKERLQRKIDLQRATSLSNIDKTKVKIYFKSNEGIYRVHTTIWATTEKNISFKGGVIIPIACVMRVI